MPNSRTCSYCFKTFTRFTHRKRHEDIHLNAKPYQCTECGVRFNDPSNLTRHTESHRKGNWRSCVHCGQPILGKKRMQRHVEECSKRPTGLSVTELVLCTPYYTQCDVRHDGHIYVVEKKYTATKDTTLAVNESQILLTYLAQEKWLLLDVLEPAVERAREKLLGFVEAIGRAWECRKIVLNDTAWLERCGVKISLAFYWMATSATHETWYERQGYRPVEPTDQAAILCERRRASHLRLCDLPDTLIRLVPNYRHRTETLKTIMQRETDGATLQHLLIIYASVLHHVHCSFYEKLLV